MTAISPESDRETKERPHWVSSALCAALGPLGAKSSPRLIGAGQTLFTEGDRVHGLFIVVSGCIKTYKMLLDGRRQITGFVFRDDFLGLPLRHGCYAFTAEAVTSACISCVPRERFEKLAASSPEFALRLVEFVSNELALAQDQLLLLGRKNAVERVGSFLLGLLQRQHANGLHGNRIHLSMPQMDIADYLGIRHETVSRALATLRRKHAICFITSDEILIQSNVRLTALAGAEDESALVGDLHDLTSGAMRGTSAVHKVRTRASALDGRHMARLPSTSVHDATQPFVPFKRIAGDPDQSALRRPRTI